MRWTHVDTEPPPMWSIFSSFRSRYILDEPWFPFLLIVLLADGFFNYLFVILTQTNFYCPSCIDIQCEDKQKSTSNKITTTYSGIETERYRECDDEITILLYFTIIIGYYWLLNLYYETTATIKPLASKTRQMWAQHHKNYVDEFIIFAIYICIELYTLKLSYTTKTSIIYHCAA